MSGNDDLIQNSEPYARPESAPVLSAVPRRKLAVIACMDARIIVSRILGLEEGDAHIIRNAGGVVTEDVIRSLIISQRLLGTEEILVIHHTDCGMLKFKEDQLKREIERETGVRPPFALGAFEDLAADVRQSMALIQASPFIPCRDRVRGCIYDLESRRLEPVAP